MNKLLILSLFFSFIAKVDFAQTENFPISNEAQAVHEAGLQKLDANFHSSVKPFLTNEMLACGIKKQSFLWQGKSILADAYTGIQLSYDSTEYHWSILALPLFRSSYAFDLAHDSTYSALGGGIQLDVSDGRKFHFGGNIITDNSAYLSYLTPAIDSLNIIPGNGFAHPTSQGFSFTRWSGYVSYSPHRIFNLQTGFGKHFWGDGYRSLLLSDNSYNYPYLRLSATFWRIKYVSLFAMMQDIRFSNGDPSKFIRKYASMHYLNWNISRRVSLGIFEAVVWQAKDTLLNRQFDINYLNPFVFYRPVEYALGSSDNALLGLNLKVKITDKYQVYGQALLDEFLLSEVKRDSGWWANKYGFQFGAKAIEPFGVKNLQLQTEFNVVRPFTYSHGSVKQNYAHYNAPLAHPYGSNFKEWVSFLRYSWKNIHFEEQFITAEFGSDTSIANLGNNLYQSYSNRYQDYNNEIGQGLNNKLIYNQVKLSWMILPQTNLRVYLMHILRVVRNSYGSFPSQYFQVGISTNLWNQYTDH